MCLKRQRDGHLLPSSNLAKRAAVEPGLESWQAAVQAWGNQIVLVADPEIHHIMEKEKHRQFKNIEDGASENFFLKAVMDALGIHLTNKYLEGMPGSRNYTGNEYIDQIEFLCFKRALAAFNLDPEKLGVNVQPDSCTSANFAVYTSLLLPGDQIMGLEASSGGHLSHGYHTTMGKNIFAASIFFECLSCKVYPQTVMSVIIG